MAEPSFEDESLEEDDNRAMRQRCACRGAESSKDAGSLKLGIIMTTVCLLRGQHSFDMPHQCHSDLSLSFRPGRCSTAVILVFG